MSDARFPKSNRLLRKGDFDRVFSVRRSAAAGPLVVYVAKNEVGVPRLGLVVSRKLGSAVVRNRWKRRLREAFRLEKQNLPQDIDILVIPRWSEVEEVDKLREVLVRTVQKLIGRVVNKP
jgi:ribonuclease P protein component